MRKNANDKRTELPPITATILLPCTGGENRTPSLWFWRPTRLTYSATPVFTTTIFADHCGLTICNFYNYENISKVWRNRARTDNATFRFLLLWVIRFHKFRPRIGFTFIQKNSAKYDVFISCQTFDISVYCRFMTEDSTADLSVRLVLKGRRTRTLLPAERGYHLTPHFSPKTFAGFGLMVKQFKFKRIPIKEIMREREDSNLHDRSQIWIGYHSASIQFRHFPISCYNLRRLRMNIKYL